MKQSRKTKKNPSAGAWLGAVIFLSVLTTGCASNRLHQGARELTGNLPEEKVNTADIMDSSYEPINPRKELTEFSLELLQENLSQDNCLISPLSIVSALGMTVNGAEGDTRMEMEQMMGTDAAVLNDYLKAYTDAMPDNKKHKVNIANSIWFRDSGSLTIKQDFLKTSRDYYHASIFEAPFDTGTKDDINNWVRRETNGMIQKLMEEAPPRDAVMYLVNALSFDGEWQKIYEKDQIHQGKFRGSLQSSCIPRRLPISRLRTGPDS